MSREFISVLVMVACSRFSVSGDVRNSGAGRANRKSPLSVWTNSDDCVGLNSSVGA